MGSRCWWARISARTRVRRRGAGAQTPTPRAAAGGGGRRRARPCGASAGGYMAPSGGRRWMGGERSCVAPGYYRARHPDSTAGRPAAGGATAGRVPGGAEGADGSGAVATLGAGVGDAHAARGRCGGTGPGHGTGETKGRARRRLVSRFLLSPARSRAHLSPQPS
ncbi:hypothetical protein FB451DRAFT_1229618 [Mycena latifolia]|nr:hypothetical protein FB451DRAFT_1229618 [Mycena latifolia]